MDLKRRLFAVLSVVGLGAILVLGLLQLFELRFRAGDIFPAYSSYRSDPQGAKILFQSLEKYRGVAAHRLLKPLKDENTAGKTVLFLGCGFYSVRADMDEVLDPFLTSGGHAVVAFKPASATYSRYQKEEEVCDETTAPEDAETDDDADSKEDGEKHDPKTCPDCQRRDVQERWQVDLERFTRKELKALDPEEIAFPTSGNPELEPVSWSSALWFDNLGEEWNVLYEYLDKPVIIEREWGAGSVVLMADSYLFSNEAMVQDRQTALLVKLMDSRKTILFDELHLGVESQEGIMMLVNRYGLTGVLLALLVLAGLFIWQRSSSFVPKYTDPNSGDNEVGLSVDARQGFTNLLVRHIPQKLLIKTMVSEWNSTVARMAAMKTKNEKLNAEFQRLEKRNEKKHPVDIYNQLLKFVNERK
ncbi:DUF4350 domain-containing protein [Pontiellaceae bacterium B1224]|nr:DUF4350 domain-containing protein [Pontiellaceae bacterium B1224]